MHTKGGEETQNNRTRWNSKGHIEQTQPENESRYPRTLQEENPQGITEVDTRENPQHERDDNSERRQVEPHKDLAHTQSKAPRAQESSNINELWKRTKAAQTKTKTKRKKAEDRRKGRTKQEATTAAKDNRDNEEDNEKWATKTEEPPTLEPSYEETGMHEQEEEKEDHDNTEPTTQDSNTDIPEESTDMETEDQEEKQAEDMPTQIPRSNYGIFIDALYKHLKKEPEEYERELYLNQDMDEMEQDHIEEALTKHHKDLQEEDYASKRRMRKRR